MRAIGVTVSMLALAAMAAACGGKDESMCSLETNEGCSDGKVCERISGGTTHGCFAPVSLKGRVFDLASNAALQGARVVAIDAEGTAASGVATSAADGTYSLRVPAARNADGAVAVSDVKYTLRADAQGYQAFPGGVRPALTVDVSNAVQGDNGASTIMNTTTDVGLLALPAGARGSIAGRVDASEAQRGGVLVVGGGSSTLTDRDGTFVLFNATPGAVTLRGYAAGVQLAPANTTVTDGMQTAGVVIGASSDPLATVSGNIQIVNAPGGSRTTVVLVVRETFNANLDRGDVPRGLRAADVTGAFSFQNVPDGQYVVLAAFGNDNLVRDPDQAIGGTALVNLDVPQGGSRTISLSESFKVTEALAVGMPGAELPEAVTGTPTFSWADDSSEDGYELRVFDTFGTEIWSRTDVPSVSGSAMVSVPYGGPALTPGMYYQFRATSFRNAGGRTGGRTYISRTEELRGVFFAPRP